MEKVNDEEDFWECDDVFLGDRGDLGDEEGVGEWLIERAELSFHKKIIADNDTGHSVHAGRWHGDVNIHTFGNSSLDLGEVCSEQTYNSYVLRFYSYSDLNVVHRMQKCQKNMRSRILKR